MPSDIQDNTKRLLRLISNYKNRELSSQVCDDFMKTLTDIGKYDKEQIIEDLNDLVEKYESDGRIDKLLGPALISLLNNIKEYYPVDILPEIKRCVAYIEKKDLAKKKTFIIELIKSATNDSSKKYNLYIADSKNRIVKIVGLKEEQDSFDVALDEKEWDFFIKCYNAYPDAADFKADLNLIKDKGKKAKFYDRKYQIEKKIKGRSGGKIINVFERIGKGLFKILIGPGKVLPSGTGSIDYQSNFVRREEFDELSGKVDKIISMLEKRGGEKSKKADSVIG